MTRSFFAMALALILLSQSPRPLHAECIEQATRDLRAGTPVTILRTDSTVVKATYRSAGGDPLQLVFAQEVPHSQRPPTRLEMPASDVMRLDAPPNMRFSVSRFALSTLVGMGVGALLGAIAPSPNETSVAWSPDGTSSSSDDQVGMIVDGALAGAAGGALVGLFVGTGGRKPRTWSCADPAPGAAPAAPDSAQVPIR